MVWGRVCPGKNPISAITSFQPCLFPASSPSSPCVFCLFTSADSSPSCLSLPLFLCLYLSLPFSPSRPLSPFSFLSFLSLGFCLSNPQPTVTPTQAPQPPGPVPPPPAPFPAGTASSILALPNAFRMIRQSNAFLMFLKHAENCILMKRGGSKLPVVGQAARSLAVHTKFRGAGLVEVSAWGSIQDAASSPLPSRQCSSPLSHLFTLYHCPSLNTAPSTLKFPPHL